MGEKSKERFLVCSRNDRPVDSRSPIEVKDKLGENDSL